MRSNLLSRQLMSMKSQIDCPTEGRGRAASAAGGRADGGGGGGGRAGGRAAAINELSYQ